MPNLPPHIETIITEACWGVPGVGQLTGEAKLRAILEAAWAVAQAGSLLRTERMSTLSCSICGWYSDCVEPDPEQLQHTDCPHRKLKEAMSHD